MFNTINLAILLLTKLREEKNKFKNAYCVHKLRGKKNAAMHDGEDVDAMLSYGATNETEVSVPYLQIKDFASFHANTTTVQGTGGISYVQAYCTKRNVTYSLNPGVFRWHQAKELLQKKAQDKIISDLDIMSDVFFECTGDGRQS
ncbi:hypothetical protein BDR04DRAFT_1118334 [Suillus decipiens]|nr:hypothetical protein BDR04DRAFT_1118334 [Suillus decipiens]